jgi:hypothetical protein
LLGADCMALDHDEVVANAFVLGECARHSGCLARELPRAPTKHADASAAHAKRARTHVPHADRTGPDATWYMRDSLVGLAGAGHSDETLGMHALAHNHLAYTDLAR